MIRFTWNGLNPWIIFKASINYFCLWIKIWFKDFRRQNIGTVSKRKPAVIKKKGQTMSNAQGVIQIPSTEQAEKAYPKIIEKYTTPAQGSDEVQVTITVQEPEDVEKPTIH
jgi:hypothetical protein